MQNVFHAVDLIFSRDVAPKVPKDGATINRFQNSAVISARVIAENVLQIIMKANVDGLIGAGRHERSGDRTTWRNGYFERTLDTRLGTLNLKIAKLRTGPTFPATSSPARRSRSAGRG